MAKQPTDKTPPAPKTGDGGVRLVLSTAPPGRAHEIAKALVEERLAACVNLVPGLRSVYRWEGAVQDDPETALWIKTTSDRLSALSDRLASLHPYRVPEVLVVAPDGGSEPYLAWVREACAPEAASGSTTPPARPSQG